jgi:putative glutamine amidotransferase
MGFSTRPRILVTAGRGREADEYCEALREAGADPLLIAPGEPAPELTDVGGLVLTGGGDVDPALYGGELELAKGVDGDRDKLERLLLREAREQRMPTLCICRGLQIANVAFGGSLIGDIPASDSPATAIPHAPLGPNGAPRRDVIDEHIVRIAPGSLLARTAQTLNLATGSRHHQAAGRCADDLRVVASTDDGVIEALEAKFENPFWLAVQWHPESTRDLDAGASRAIFGGFVRAAVRPCVRPGGASGGATSAVPR